MKMLRWMVLPLVLAQVALAEDKVQTVQAHGEAALVGADAQAKVTARAEARKTAFRNAVETAAGTLVSAYSLTQDNVLVSDRIFSNAQGYVKNPRDEKYEEKDGVVTYTATVDVATGGIEKDLQAIRQLVQSLEGKRIVVVLQEQTYDPAGVLLQGGAMNAVLVGALKNEGWDVVDPSFLAGKVKVEAAATMGPVEAKEVGNLAEADYVLYGQASFRQHDTSKEKSLLQTSSAFLVTGEYKLTVFATDTGKVLGTLAAPLRWKAPGPKTSQIVTSFEHTAHELVRSSEEKLLQDVHKMIYASLGDARQNGNAVTVVVSGLEDFAAADDFRGLLKSRKGVTEVGEVKLRGGKATYQVVLAGSTADFARTFTRALFQKRKVRVEGKSSNKLEISVAK